jgi:hypothetical protein
MITSAKNHHDIPADLSACSYRCARLRILTRDFDKDNIVAETVDKHVEDPYCQAMWLADANTSPITTH